MAKSYLSSPVSSPCLMVCRLDQEAVCVGCGRTKEQITRWLTYTEEERKEIMASLPLKQ
ncbi:MAG TPA: DUF1289 domain-containing protein [Cytophagales bacterium]|nr:DUF1289 domain-containing protein [Cytophagales bacterium]HAA20122.1 DUF1289 domain-containing protein [Cytophagales bacterium]HAP64070.1 DUF1289 domain-containing protein [Cytophagales bacterium]